MMLCIWIQIKCDTLIFYRPSTVLFKPLELQAFEDFSVFNPEVTSSLHVTSCPFKFNTKLILWHSYHMFSTAVWADAPFSILTDEIVYQKRIRTFRNNCWDDDVVVRRVRRRRKKYLLPWLASSCQPLRNGNAAAPRPFPSPIGPVQPDWLDMAQCRSLFPSLCRLARLKPVCPVSAAAAWFQPLTPPGPHCQENFWFIAIF